MHAEAASPRKSTRSKYLTFKLGSEFYGVPIHFIREILALLPITPVPNTPQFIAGVFNMRGKIIPVIDLRVKFSMACQEHTRDTCIVVVDVAMDRARLTMGLIVDTVCEVLDFTEEQIEAVPSFGIQVNTVFLKGMARSGDAMHLILNIERVLSQDELNEVVDANTNSPALESSR